ncbi:MAG: hypothetical protein NTZ05_15120, partial [Chloroflexi bacterium]|nr:hypothetical protein [Chloroflexota bacterium]
ARDWSAIGGRALLGRHAETGRAVLRYRNEQGIAEELRRLIDLEGRCCAFLKFDLTADKTDLVLTVSGTGSEAFLAAEPSKIIT